MFGIKSFTMPAVTLRQSGQSILRMIVWIDIISASNASLWF